MEWFGPNLTYNVFEGVILNWNLECKSKSGLLQKKSFLLQLAANFTAFCSKFYSILQQTLLHWGNWLQFCISRFLRVINPNRVSKKPQKLMIATICSINCIKCCSILQQIWSRWGIQLLVATLMFWRLVDKIHTQICWIKRDCCKKSFCSILQQL